jgi:hypothetical protein
VVPLLLDMPHYDNGSSGCHLKFGSGNISPKEFFFGLKSSFNLTSFIIMQLRSKIPSCLFPGMTSLLEFCFTFKIFLHLT